MRSDEEASECSLFNNPLLYAEFNNLEEDLTWPTDNGTQKAELWRERVAGEIILSEKEGMLPQKELLKSHLSKQKQTLFPLAISNIFL